MGGATIFTLNGGAPESLSPTPVFVSLDENHIHGITAASVEEASNDDNNNTAPVSESNTLRPSAMQVEESNNDLPKLDDRYDVHVAQRASSGDLGVLERHNEEMMEAKIVARVSPEDDPMFSDTSSQLRMNVSMEQIVAKVPTSYHARTQSALPKYSRTPIKIDLSRGQIDTAVPFESVKAAVSKFGGMVDWKAQRVQTVEKQKSIDQELKKAQEEVQTYKKQSEAAEIAKTRVLKNLNNTKTLIEELNHKLEQAQKEEEHAIRAAELTKLKVEEMEQKIADGSSFSAKGQLEFAMAKHATTVAELKTTKDELEQLKTIYASLLAEKDEALRKTQEATSASKEAEASIQELANKLESLRQSLDSIHAANLDAEKRRTETAMVKQQESVNWEMEPKQAEEEHGKLNELMLSTKDVRAELLKATTLLQTTKAQLEAYMESKTSEELKLDDIHKQLNVATHADIEIALATAKKELAEAKEKVDKANNEVNTLKVTATSLKSEVDTERKKLAAMKQRDCIASNEVLYLESELNKIEPEIAHVHKKEKVEKTKKKKTLKRLHEIGNEADQAKALAKSASNELQKVKEQAEHAKEERIAMEDRLHTAQHEIEVARTAEKLALTALHALAETESSENSPDEIMITLEEYHQLCIQAHEAEEQANIRVATALAQLEAAKAAQLKSLDMLESATLENSNQKSALETALEKANKAEEAKLAVEEELGRKMSSKDVLAPTGTSLRARTTADRKQFYDIFSSPGLGLTCLQPTAITRSKTETELRTMEKLVPKKKKKSFFPRLFMFLFRKKTSASSKTA